MDKAWIIQEIIRTANENGGSPLGISRFQAETGIKRNDWWGKYWIKWGDAIVEAGFKPNSFQALYPQELLLDHLASLVRELGHFPVAVELRMKARQDPGFPSHSTFERLGRKHDKATRLAEYCRAKGGMEDVEQLCALASAPSGDQDHDSVEQPTEEIGFVYLLRSGRYYKIGHSNSVGRRERELGIQLPEKSKTVHVIRTDDPLGIEAYWHSRFQDKHLNGEWFALTAGDINAFKRRKFM